jgi:integrase
MVYHLIHRFIRGKKRWGYYWRERSKRVVRIVHPRTGQPFRNKREVELWIRELQDGESVGYGVTVRQLAEFMFLPTSEWANRRARQRDGQELSPHTLYEHNTIVQRYVLPEWGNDYLVDLRAPELEDWLYDLDVSNRYRRTIAGTWNMIFKIAERKGILAVAPRLELPSKTSRKPDILTAEMLKKVFPKERAELRKVWTNQDNKKEPADAWLMFAALFSTMFYGGLRPQEARAVHVDQFHLQLGAILVTRSMDRQNQVQSYLKMGNDRDPRYRVAILPDRAVTMIRWWLKVAASIDFVFTFASRPLNRDLPVDRLRKAIGNAGISTEGKRYIPYSGRYTFVTLVKPLLDRAALMALIGHVDEAMPERYDVPYLLERAKQLQSVRKQLGAI